jgi:hypothetical protein
MHLASLSVVVRIHVIKTKFVCHHEGVAVHVETFLQVVADAPAGTSEVPEVQAAAVRRDTGGVHFSRTYCAFCGVGAVIVGVTVCLA